MKFRSHLARSFDPSSPWNRAVVLLSVAAGVLGALLTFLADRDLWLAVQAGGTTFLCWALTRELDPDRQMSAMVAAAGGATWVLLGQPTALLSFAGLLLVARLIVETTGRRPLSTDLAAMAILATVISVSPLGWVMGFGLAIAVYVDDRLATEHNRQALLAAMAAGVGASVVVTWVGALPDAALTIRPLFAILVGLLALIAVVREPVEPISFVDSRNKRFIRRDRLQAGRSAAGVLIFIGAFVSGDAGHAVVPMAFALLVALGSSELERIQRARL